jgi:PleD family two-component response regulator
VSAKRKTLVTCLQTLARYATDVGLWRGETFTRNLQRNDTPPARADLIQRCVSAVFVLPGFTHREAEGVPLPTYLGGGTVLIVRPESSQETELYDTLHGAGYQVAVSVEPHGGCAPPPDVDIVLLIASEPDLQTCDVCRAIKSTRPTLPLIVIGPDIATTKLRFFSLGADDYVLRPFDRLELLARIKSQIRRVESRRMMQDMGEVGS